MRVLLTLCLALLATTVSARVIEVSPGGTYSSLGAAAALAQPGDSIVFRAGIYPGGDHVSNLQGTANAWITITSAASETVVIRGGGNAWQLSDPAYVLIAGFNFEGQTGNGVNIDDAGTYETPAHHIIIVGCRWGALNATGNNDQLKMSGIDSFAVVSNVFQNGSPGGSMIDMVGCHAGQFAGNIFEDAGSNCIQAKGGTQYIRIEGNRFVNGGLRAINIGGSTGLEFFRPLGTLFEAANIAVYSNIFTGAEAPIAYVGSINCIVANNTIWIPNKWAIRILQETTVDGFSQCGDNAFINNIVVIDNRASINTLNIGPNTRPETFVFSHNLWYNVDNATWAGPNLPSTEVSGLVGRNPLLTAPPNNMVPAAGSPAIGAGVPLPDSVLDYRMRPFLNPPSIGAFEAGTTSSVQSELSDDVRIFSDRSSLTVELPKADPKSISIIDIAGRTVRTVMLSRDENRYIVDLQTLPGGAYLVIVNVGRSTMSRLIMRR